jgi:hypothetical protein
VLSKPFDAKVFPSGANATQVTPPVCPRRDARSFPAATSQTLTDMSFEADASVFPSGENATERTQSP